MTKVGQVYGRLGALFCLLLVVFCFAGCQTNSTDSGFSEVPGLSDAAGPSSATAVPAAGTPAAAANPATATTRTNTDTAEIIHAADTLGITFGDLPTPIQPILQKVKDDGTVTLLYNQVFQAAGKRVGDLEREIREFYVPAYYRYLTVSIQILQDTRLYYVDGEVRTPGPHAYTGPITVTKAIASAGGFTDFANKRSVKLIHSDNRTEIINCNKVLDHPELDPQVYPNDKIFVKRRIF